MKILNALEPYDYKKPLKVGSSDGSGFFYCGTVGNFVEDMEDHSDLLRKHALASVQAANRRLNQRLSNPPTIDRFCREELRSDKPNLTFENYRFYVDHYFAAIKGFKSAADTQEEHYEAFKPLSKREVVEIREASDAADPGVTILIIDGYELGKYWTVGEAKGKSYIAFMKDSGDDDDAAAESL